MTRRDMVEGIMHRAGLDNLTQAEQALSAILEAISNDLTRGGGVSLRGFGAFGVVERGARPGRNPRTGKALTIEARRVVRFTPGQGLRKAVAGKAGPDLRSFKDFTRVVEDQLKDLRVRLESYRPKAEALGEEARKAYRELAEKTTVQSAEAKARLKVLSASGGEAWKEVRQGLERALGELRESFKRARGKF